MALSNNEEGDENKWRESVRKLQSGEKREYRMRKDNKIENRRIRRRQTETRR